MPLPALLSGGFMFSDRLSVCPSVRTSRKFVNSVCYKPLGGISTNLQFWCTCDKYELITYLAQKSKVKVVNRPNIVQKGKAISLRINSCPSLFCSSGWAFHI